MLRESTQFALHFTKEFFSLMHRLENLDVQGSGQLSPASSTVRVDGSPSFDGGSPHRMLRGRQKISRIFLRNAHLYAKTHYVFASRSDISSIFLKNALWYAKTHYIFVFKPPLQHAEMLLNAHKNARKRTKTPGAWCASHQLAEAL